MIYEQERNTTRMRKTREVEMKIEIIYCQE